MTGKLIFNNVEKRNRFVVKQKNRGRSNQSISSEVGLSIRQIQNIFKTAKEEQRFMRKKGSERPEALSKYDKMRISKKKRKNPYYSSAGIQRSLGLKAARHTVYRHLKRRGLTHKKATIVSSLKKADLSRRLEWAHEHRATDWRHVIFTDETTFALNKPQYGWAPRSSRIQQKSQCYDPKLQIWGSICELDKVHFTFYEGSLTSNKYVEILGSELLPEARKLLGKNWILQQDGARAHTANHSMNFLKGERVRVLSWPARSPDLNPIENLWSVLKHNVYQRNPQDIKELRMCVEEEINNIDQELVSSLASSMQNRIEMLIENEGNNIGY